MAVRISKREAAYCLWQSDGFVDTTPATPKRRRPPSTVVQANSGQNVSGSSAADTVDSCAGLYEVEAIVAERLREGRTEFRVRWAGYTATDDTWEPYDNLHRSIVFQSYWAAQQHAVATPAKKAGGPRRMGRAPRSRGRVGAGQTRPQFGTSFKLKAPRLKFTIPDTRAGPQSEHWRDLARGGFKRRNIQAGLPVGTSSRIASRHRLMLATNGATADEPISTVSLPAASEASLKVPQHCTSSRCHPTNCVCLPPDRSADGGAIEARASHCISSRCHPTNCVCTPPPPPDSTENDDDTMTLTLEPL